MSPGGGQIMLLEVFCFSLQIGWGVIGKLESEGWHDLTL